MYRRYITLTLPLLFLFSQVANLWAKSWKSAPTFFTIAITHATSPAPAPSPSLPGPPYPRDALSKGIQGVVTVDVRWDGDGDVVSCRVVISSGSRLLDEKTVSFIKEHWISQPMAGKELQTPITYRLQARPPGPSDPGHLGLVQLLTSQGFTWTSGSEDTGNATFYVVLVDGKPFNLRLDTGTGSNLVLKDSVNHAHLATHPGNPDPIPAYELPDDPPADKTETLDVTSMQVGTQSCIPTKTRVSDFFVRSMNGVMYEGSLGLDFLKANHAVILVNPPLLFLNAKHGASIALDTWLRARGSTTVPLEYYQRHYFLPVRFDGYPARMRLGTAVVHTIIKSQLIKKDHFAWSRGVDLIGFMNGATSATGSVPIDEFEVGGFPFGSVDLQTLWHYDPKAKLPIWNYDVDKDPLSQASLPGDWRDDGVLGDNLLSSVYTVIDCSSDRIYFRAPPAKK